LATACRYAAVYGAVEIKKEKAPMKKLVLFSLILVMFSVTSASAATPHLVDVDVDFPAHGIFRTTLVFQEGQNPLNRFTMQRVRKVSLVKQRPLLLLSPFNASLGHYELSTGGSYTESFIGNLAENGIDVWGLEDRFHRGTADSCEAGRGNDCAVMATWDLHKRVEDAEFTRQLILAATGGVKPVIGGNTGGGFAALAAINAYPTHYRGVYASGSIFSNDPAVQARNRVFCEAFEAQLAAGQIFFDGLSQFTPIVAAARAAPNDPSPFAPGLTNFQFLVSLVSTPGLLGPNAFSDSYVFAAGNVGAGTLTYMNAHVFYSDFETFGTLISVQHFADISCGMADDTTYTGNLAAFKGAVKLLGTGQALGPMLQDTAALFTSASSVDVVINPQDGGEADNFLVEDALRKQLTDNQLIPWIKAQFLSPGPITGLRRSLHRGEETHRRTSSVTRVNRVDQ
jgi:pimeloyl-ACP methyl ester carboxylesterase